MLARLRRERAGRRLDVLLTHAPRKALRARRKTLRTVVSARSTV
jgi:hypothetical protein